MNHRGGKAYRPNVLVCASVASMIDQFNLPNIRLLQEMGYTVHVACNFFEGNTCDDARIDRLRKLLRSMRVVSHQWDCPRSIWPIGKCRKAYRQFERLLGRYAFAWMHCQSPVGGALARMAAHQAGVSVVYTAHGFHFYRGAPLRSWLLYYPVERLLSYWTDVLVTVNREDYRLAGRRLRAKKLYRIPGIGVDCHKFAVSGSGKEMGKTGIREAYGIPAQALLLLSVGELSRRKNHQAVIAALPAVTGRNVYYLICGQGTQKDKLMRQAKRLGIERRVILAGFQPEPAPFYREADLFVFPSVQEGMPVALLEAMAAGLPCIVSDIRGSRELIGKKGGVCYDGGRQLRKALQTFLSDAELRRACGSYNQIRIRRYGVSEVESDMRRIYREMEKPLPLRIRVLHVLKSSWFSGAEQVAVTICRNCGEGFQCAYASPRGSIQKRLEAEGIAYYPMEAFTYLELCRVVSWFQPDIVHAHDFSASVLCAAAKRNFFLISHLHNNPPWIRRWNPRSFAYQMAERKIDRIMLVSQAIRNEAVFLQKPLAKTDVLGNPVDADRIRRMAADTVTVAADAPAAADETKKLYDLLFVGRFTAQKAPEAFIRIAARIRRMGIPVRAAMLGEGEREEACRELAARLGMERQIVFKGFCANPYPDIRKARLLLMPSVWEGYGLAAVEALLLGTPVLASPAGGLAGILQRVPWALCANEREFAQKAARLLRDGDLYRRFCGSVQAGFAVGDLEKYMGSIRKIYRQASFGRTSDF